MAKIVGKPSGYDGPIPEFTPNKGSAGRKKIVFVGASYLFVHRVVRDLILVGGFNECLIVIHDIDEIPLKLVGDLVERMARQAETKIEVSRTLDRAEALRNADAVLLSITIGGLESDCRSFEVCAKYGIRQGIGDTLGPPALARNLRTVPFVVQLVREMERLCPKAVLLNFTNPMSVVTCAAARFSSIPTFGLCHSADALFEYFASVFGCKKAEVELDLGGVNHQAFVTRLTVTGTERTAEILKRTSESDAELEDKLLGHKEDVKLQQDVFKILGVWPSCGEDHLAEFYPFFFTERRREQLKMHSRFEVVPGRQPLGRKEPNPLLRDWAYGPEGVGDMHLLTNEHAHELMWAVFTGEPFTRVLNVLNKGGLIECLPDDACVEALVTVKGTLIQGEPMRLPPAAHSLVQRWTTIHDLSIKAATECDRQAALQALFLDPHLRDLYDIEPMLEDFLTALKPWMPGGWYK
ncbi:MAG TPA: hypothetical protein VGP72_18140 [Planctomycetota bacterium]|jgi:alpha-galactosidase